MTEASRGLLSGSDDMSLTTHLTILHSSSNTDNNPKMYSFFVLDDTRSISSLWLKSGKQQRPP